MTTLANEPLIRLFHVPAIHRLRTLALFVILFGAASIVAGIQGVAGGA